MGTSDILLGGNPVMDKHLIQRGVATLLLMLHAKETGISSSCLRLWQKRTQFPTPLEKCKFSSFLNSLLFESIMVGFRSRRS